MAEIETIEQTPIETARLILRPYSEADVGDIFSYASNTEVTKYLLWDAHKSIEDSRNFLKWIQSVTCNERGKLFFVYAIYLKQENKVIGSIDFKNTHRFGGQIDYVIGKNYWGNGYVSEAAEALKGWAFYTMPELVRLQSYCLPENKASQRVMEKVGMQYEGLRKKSFIVKNKPVDIVHYAFVKDQ